MSNKEDDWRNGRFGKRVSYDSLSFSSLIYRGMLDDYEKSQVMKISKNLNKF